mmetsp:Transcript_7589/g.7132  ORF Transcript_7589/g.7132 Transcript_7589/m.7132 type:complete len:80 (+) Transcript_7589:57-296(+)
MNFYGRRDSLINIWKSEIIVDVYSTWVVFLNAISNAGESLSFLCKICDLFISVFGREKSNILFLTMSHVGIGEVPVRFS